MDINKYKIDKDIPAPEVGGKWINLLERMEVGDSTFFEDKAQANAFASRAIKIKGKRVVISRAEGTGARVWRIK